MRGQPFEFFFFSDENNDSLLFYPGLRSLAGKRGRGGGCCEAQKAKDVGLASIQVVNMAEHG